MRDALDFRYGLLRSSKTSIRLAQILSGSGNKGISINLVESFVTGPNKAPYDALSYTWGDGARTKSIGCNGRRLAVTQTLLGALQRFRDPDKIVTLWIDQICICQERVKERNAQVQMMGDIFKAARKVIVWLGEDYDGSQAGMTLARQLLHVAKSHGLTWANGDHTDMPGLPRRGDSKWKALSAVLRRPWFWRTWIVQEVVLNPVVELVLGRNTLTWDELEIIVTVLDGPLPKIWELDQAVSASELPFSRINRIRLRHRRAISSSSADLTDEPDDLNNSDLVRLDSYGDDPELLDLLLMSRGLGATDPRDKVYALLGLGKHDISPDYETSPEDVFIEFALHQIGAVTDKLATAEANGSERPSARDVEVRRALVMLACAGRVNQQLILPSWVPDWTVNLSSRPLIFGLGYGERYSAGGSELGTFDWHFDIGLQLSGVLLDTIQAVGTILLDYDTDAAAHTTIAEWWREAQVIALERIARSPGSTLYTDAFEAMRRRLKLCTHGYYVGEPTQKRRGSLLDDIEANTSAAHSASQTLTLGPTRGRVMFASSIGFLGLVPYGTREGDVVFIVRGADVPYVLRPRDSAYELIGEAFVQGVMDGEALTMGNVVSQDIVIQ